MEITLEKVDQVRERTGVSYAKAKEALEHTNGSVLDAIILLESEMKNENSFNDGMKGNNGAETVEEFKIWLKDLINKGNVSRIKISKDVDFNFGEKRFGKYNHKFIKVHIGFPDAFIYLPLLQY